MKGCVKLAKKSSEAKRIIFQPTEENRKKLFKIAEKSGVSVSLIINLLLDELDIEAKVEIHLLNNSNSYDFEAWKDVQDREVEYWHERLFNEMKNVANADVLIGNWENVKSYVNGNTEDSNVKEEFTFDNEEWLNEIYVQIKPYFERWLEELSKDTEIDYSDYIKNFWN